MTHPVRFLFFAASIDTNGYFVVATTTGKDGYRHQDGRRYFSH
jgi:hypothetical protein